MSIELGKIIQIIYYMKKNSKIFQNIEKYDISNNGNALGKGNGGISKLTKDVITRIDLTRNAFIMALTGQINGDMWR